MEETPLQTVRVLREYEDVIRTDLRALREELAAEKECRRQTDLVVKNLESQLRILMARFDQESRDVVADCLGARTMLEDSSHATMFENGVSSRPSRELEIHRCDESRSYGLTARGDYASLADMTALDSVEFRHKDLTEDMWGVAIMLFTRERYEMSVDGATCGTFIRFVYASMCVLLNLLLQVGVVYWVHQYIVGFSVWSIQGQYARFHREIFNRSGEFLEDKWISHPDLREQLCDAVINRRLFLSVILFLWFGRMLGEVKLIVRMIREINNLPGSAIGATITHCIHVRQNGEESLTEIIALSRGTRFLVYALIVFPKLGVALLLAVLGGQWLTATLSYADLILNALALEFIIDIDENILQFFLPHRIIARLGSTKFAYPITEEKDSDLIRDYQRNITFFIICVISTVVWVFYLQQVLPFGGSDIAEHCGNWFLSEFTPACPPFQKGCFPYGDVSPSHHYDAVSPALGD